MIAVTGPDLWTLLVTSEAVPESVKTPVVALNVPVIPDWVVKPRVSCPLT